MYTYKIYESITPMVLELGVNGHFSARTCGVHQNGAKTWLGHANTVLIAFVYGSDADEACHVARGLLSVTALFNS